MKSRFMPWEERNLGVKSSIEYYVEAHDSVKDLFEIWESKHEYQLMNIESGNVQALIEAQNNGFRLIETKLKLKRKLDDVSMPSGLSRFESVLDYREATAEDLEHALKIVKEGGMFLTDRVALDPHFGRIIAGNRYYNWAKDVTTSGAITVITLYKDEKIGFEIFTENKSICTNIIGGVFPEWANKGLGFAPLYMELLLQKKRDNKMVQTEVSSNNLPVLKIHESLGFKVDGIIYSLVKHV